MSSRSRGQESDIRARCTRYMSDFPLRQADKPLKRLPISFGAIIVQRLKPWGFTRHPFAILARDPAKRRMSGKAVSNSSVLPAGLAGSSPTSGPSRNSIPTYKALTDLSSPVLRPTLAPCVTQSEWHSDPQSLSPRPYSASELPFSS